MQPLWKTLLQKAKDRITIRSKNSTLSYTYLKELKTDVQNKPCTIMSTAALLTIAKVWKQPKCPLTDKAKQLTILTIEYCLAIKRYEVLIYATTSKQLRNIMLSERS